MNIYLDIDGVLLDEKGALIPGAPDFVKGLIDNHDVYWLTTLCKDGNTDRVMEILGKVLPSKDISRLAEIKPTTWQTLKTEAIDFSQDFRWFDDTISPEEKKVLAEHNAENNFILVPVLYLNLKSILHRIKKGLGLSGWFKLSLLVIIMLWVNLFLDQMLFLFNWAVFID